MNHETNGSKPGQDIEHDNVTGINTFPNAEFTIPPPDTLTRCRSAQIQTVDAPVSEKEPEYPKKVTATTDEEKQSTISDDEEIFYPEGGLEAWLVVLGSFLGLVAGFGTMNSIGAYQSYIKEHQLKDYSESSVGWIFSMYVFLSFFCGLQIGPVFDKYGPRQILLAGSILLCASLFLLSVCTKYWHFFLVFGVVGGMGTSLIFVPGFSACSHFFFKRRAYATGISATGGSLGGVVFPLMLQKLLPSVGFAWATRIIGFIALFCCLLSCLLVKSRLPPKPGQSAIPDFGIFRDRSYLLFTIAIFLMEWALFIPIAYLAVFANSTGALSSAFSFQLIAIFNAGSCLGRWIPGLLADVFGRFNTMIAMLAFSAVTSLTLWLPASLLPATSTTAIKLLCIFYSVLFGFASGSNISLTPVCVGQLCSVQNLGKFYSSVYTIVSFGTLTGIPLAGSLIQATGGRYWAAITFTIVCYVLSCFCCVWSRALHVGWWSRAKF